MAARDAGVEGAADLAAGTVGIVVVARRDDLWNTAPKSAAIAAGAVRAA